MKTYNLNIKQLTKLCRDFQADCHDGFVSNDEAYVEKWLEDDMTIIAKRDYVALATQVSIGDKIDALERDMAKTIIKYLKVFDGYNKHTWRAINKITIELYGDLDYKELVRANLNKLVKGGLLQTKLSDRHNDDVGNLKYSITYKGRQFLKER